MKNNANEPNLIFNENLNAHIDIAQVLNLVGSTATYENYKDVSNSIDDAIKFISTSFNNDDVDQNAEMFKTIIRDLYDIRDLFSNIKQLKK